MEYTCIECGTASPDLYKKHGSGIIKVSFCENCKHQVDKYVLYDRVLVFLDAVLHKPQVYRHLLHNQPILSPWKPFLIFLLCDTYLKWDNLHGNSHNKADSGNGYKFYAALEVDFYKMLLVSLFEWFCFCSVLLILTRIGRSSFSKAAVLSGIVISSFGKLLVIPAIIWAQTHSAIYLWLTQLFVFTSNVTALTVLCNSRYLSTIVKVVVAFAVQYVAGTALKQQIST